MTFNIWLGGDVVDFGLVQVRPGEVFALANVHLTSDPYGPYAVRDGRSLARVLALERRARLPEIRATLRRLPDGIPTLMTGDFNTPSHLDWPSVPWPVTVALAQAGFQDTYRVVHPDPVAKPGITWTYGYPSRA